MAIAYRASASGAGGNTVNVTVPAAVQAGDLLVMPVFVNTDCVVITPSGWTVAKAQQSSEVGGVNGAVYSRIATSGDASTVVSVVNDAAAGVKAGGGIVAYSGVDTTLPIPLAIAATLYTGGSASITSPSLPSVPAGCFVVEAALTKATSTTTFSAIPAGSTQRVSLIGTGGGHADLCIADRGPVSAGTYGGGTWTQDATMSSGIAYTIAIAELSTTQRIRPTTDVTTSGFSAVPTPGGGVALASTIGEAVRDDATYVQSPAAATGAVYECRVGAALDPASDADHTVTAVLFTGGGAVSGSCTVALVQGTTVIASSVFSGLTSSPAVKTFTLTGPEADAITDYADLRVRFTWTVS